MLMVFFRAGAASLKANQLKQAFVEREPIHGVVLQMELHDEIDKPGLQT